MAVGLAAFLSAMLLFVSAASAAVPELLVKSPEDGLSGEGAGQLLEPRGIATNPNLPGDAYVVDGENQRIGEFTPWGEFVQAWGWGVEDGASSEFQTCTETTGCKKGIKGSGVGQFKDPEAIATDSGGNVYVIEGENRRVQKFDSAGNFLLMFGREVNETTKANVCTKANLEGGNVCGAGAVGVGLGWLGASYPSYVARLTISLVNDLIYVGEGSRIQIFNPNGSFKEAIEGGCLEGKSVRTITADGGDLYVAFAGSTDIRKLKGSGPVAECAPAPIFKAEGPPSGLAPNSAGGLYAIVLGGGDVPRVLEFDASGTCVNCGEKGEDGKSGFDRSPDSVIGPIALGTACESVDVYVGHFAFGSVNKSFVNVWGDPPNVEVCPPPKRAPEVTAQYALSAEATEATVQALINPKFWPDTRYYLEYGTAPCATGGCPTKQPLPPGSLLTTRTTKTPLKTAAILLEGLAPETTYFYRFVAASEGGGPVFGTGSEPGSAILPEATFEAGGEASFTTFSKIEIKPCPINEEFRIGASALLPDCRAYELVSPLDKGSGDIVVRRTGTNRVPATLDQSSLDGAKLAYGAYRSFDSAPSAPFTSQYIATRSEKGWATHGISPPRERADVPAAEQFDTELNMLSPDLCEAWFRTLAEPPLALAAVAGYPNLYRRQDSDCGGLAWEALTTVKPPNLPARDYVALELQGRSTDGTATIYVANDSLEGSGAPPQPPTCEATGEACRLKLYYRQAAEATPHYACVLPDGAPFTGNCSAGTGRNDSGRSEQSNYQGAISADGSRVFWSEGNSGSGAIYMREHPGEAETGEKDSEGDCVPDPVLACTLAVSAEGEELSGASGSQFWAADPEGTRTIFSSGKDLYVFETGTRATALIAPKTLGIVGVSEDAERVYLVSEEACGDGGQAGDRNLYLYEAGEKCGAGELALVAVLGGGDGPISNPEPIRRPARVSADGLHAAFMSSAAPTGYDNTDVKTGKADAEVYLYDAAANGGAGELVCASCNPSGTRPLGFVDSFAPNGGFVEIAGRIPAFENNFYAARALSDDGNRLFFESSDALTPRDTNGIVDVYQWEALGSGECKETSSSFAPANGGCVDLVSSGQGSQAARFVDASPDGSDVFFATLESLLGQDYGLVDIYDARVGGGLPEPPPPPVQCEAESCQHPAPAPDYISPPSGLYDGPGNSSGKRPKKTCPKGKVKKGGKCVKKKKGKAKKTGRAGR